MRCACGPAVERRRTWNYYAREGSARNPLLRFSEKSPIISR